MSTPAAKVIEMCGGAKAVAAMVGREKSRVHRWTHDKARGGTGGKIPADVQPVLLLEARLRGVDLRPEHFFDDAWRSILVSREDAA